MESSLHDALEIYGFIAVTADAATLEQLIAGIKKDNNRRQYILDGWGRYGRRILDVSEKRPMVHNCVLTYTMKFSRPCCRWPRFELVVLHPEHFLPQGAPLVVRDPATRSFKPYVVAEDRRLRESSDPESPALPLFSQDDLERKMNVFLVVLNADIRFRRYLSQSPPPENLPEDVRKLMQLTIELADLIHWELKATRGTKGERIFKRLEKKRLAGMKTVDDEVVIEVSLLFRINARESHTSCFKTPWPPGMKTVEDARNYFALLSFNT